MSAQSKKAKNHLRNKGFRARYCAGDRTPSVVKQWNKYVRDRRAGLIKTKQPAQKPDFDASKLRKPIEDYTPNYLYRIGCREPWVMKAVAEKARQEQTARRAKHEALLRANGVPTVKTWKNAAPKTHVRPLVQAEQETR
jgi:hypothetical protein